MVYPWALWSHAWSEKVNGTWWGGSQVTREASDLLEQRGSLEGFVFSCH